MPQNNRIGVNSIPNSNNSTLYIPKSQYGVMYGRVYSVLLTDDQYSADELNVSRGTIGAIQFRFIENGSVDENLPLQTATHLDPNLRKFPIKNEIVEIVTGHNTSASDPKGNTTPSFYYKGVIDVWNSAEHNSIPDVSFTAKDGPVTGPDFKENGNLVRLKHLPGDIVNESRFGSSIRMGSANEAYKDAPWTGPTGSPTVVIRNGQRVDLSSDTLVTFEDLNKDGSVFILLSKYQTIDFSPANLNFDSYQQNVDVSKVVTVATVNNTPAASSASTFDTFPSADTNPVFYPVQASSVSDSTAADDLAAVPDQETPEYSQEFEDDQPRHIADGSQPWVSSLSNEPVSVTDVLSSSNMGGLDKYFIAYMQHQQGQAGLKAILYYAKAGSKTVPSVNQFTKAPVQANMKKNIGSDFGNIELTPINFINYWKIKFSETLRSIPKLIASNSLNRSIINTISKYSSKYGIPVNFSIAVSTLESSLAPNSGNSKYKGLFAISLDEFNAIYPSDSDIFNPDKNANVGIQVLKTWLGSVQNVLNVLQ